MPSRIQPGRCSGLQPERRSGCCWPPPSSRRRKAAYLQTDEDAKPEIIAEPPPDPAWFNCWFCRSTDRRVLFGAEYPVRDPNSLAVITLIFICDKCVANFAESLAQERPKAPPTQ